MKIVMVRYKVKAERVSEHLDYINQVFDQLQSEAPEGLHYASFRQGDGVSFVHLSAFDRLDGVNPLSTMSAFKAFGAQIKDRCEEQPIVVELNEVGSYRLFVS